MKLIKIGQNYIPLFNILRFKIDEDIRVKVFTNEMIGPFPKWISTSRFNSYEEAVKWINDCYVVEDEKID